ncbi:RCC1 domain-containing protein [Nonomuraea sp. NPDC050153]|uniref:RCC1 domain-containing protein n=1 Tax=Nonomuraea sp. NPDC050153 TaxID=3364359 RepID=UPI0037B207F2
MSTRRLLAVLAAVLVTAGLAGVVPAAEAAAPTTHAIAWGQGGYGQLGNGGNDDQKVPVNVGQQDAGFTEVAGSLTHSLAIAADGSVWAWGENNNGQLGDGTYTDTNVPVKVQNLNGVVEVAAGLGFSLARTSTGNILAWGDNTFGQLGLGWFGGSAPTPQPLHGQRDITHIEAGWFHSMALRNFSTVLVWGSNSRGQLGDGTDISKASPTELTGLGGESGPPFDIAAGFYHSLAVRGDGTLLAWGANNFGQLGNGTTAVTPSFSPVPVIGSYGPVKALAAGCTQSYLVDGSGRVWAWGDNSQAQVAFTGSVVTQPQIIPNLSGVQDVAAGCAFGLALTGGGGAYGWGKYESGQTGTGVPVPMPPFPVNWTTGITFIAAGGDHGLAIKKAS